MAEFMHMYAAINLLVSRTILYKTLVNSYIAEAQDNKQLADVFFLIDCTFVIDAFLLWFILIVFNVSSLFFFGTTCSY